MKKFNLYLFLLLCAALFTGCKNNPVETNNGIVTLNSPLGSEITGDSILVSISATSSQGIAGVEFYLDGNLRKSWIAPPYTYYCNLTEFSDSSRHTFQAKAKTSNGADVWSTSRAVIMRKLRTPADFDFVYKSKFNYTLAWSDNNTAESGYRIEMNKNKTGFVLLANLPANTTSYNITNTDTLSQYDYRIAAVKDSSYTTFSAAISTAFSSSNYITTNSVKAVTGVVNDMALSPDGNSIWCAGSDGYLKQISVTDGSVLKSIQAHSGSAEVICLHPNGLSLYSAGTDRKLFEWNTVSGTAVQQYSNLPATPAVLSLSADRTKLVFSSTTSKAYVFHTALFSNAYYIQADNIATLWAVASPVNNYFITFGFSGSITFYNFPDGAVIKYHPTTIGRFADFSPDGTVYALPAEGNRIDIMNVITGRRELFMQGHSTTISWLKYSPDGFYLGSLAEDKSLKVWHTTFGELVCTVTGQTDKVNRFLLTNSGEKLITGGTDGMIRIRQRLSGWAKQ